MTGPATPGSSLLRWIALAVLCAVTLGCLVLTYIVVTGDGVGDDPVDQLQSLDDEPGPNPDVEREELLKLGRDFVLRFNTYGPEMLEDGRLPEYAAITDMMTSKFDTAFEENLAIPEQLVAQSGVASEAQVYAVGISSQDADSAELLVAGTVQMSYAHPDEEGERVEDSPFQVRYQVFLRKIEGTWLVDNLDAIDDGYPPLADVGTDEQPTDGSSATPGVPTERPTDQPGGDASEGQTSGGDR